MDNVEKKMGRQRHENIIPNYDNLFRGSETVEKKNSRFLSSILKLNLGKIILSMFLYVIKASPVWVLPLITANIINIASSPLSETTWRDIIINAIVITILLLQNVPMHSLQAKLTDKMVRNTSAGIKSTVVRKLQSLSITYHKEMETGKIQSKLLKDTDSIDSLVGAIVRMVIPNIICVLIAVSISIIKSGTVTLFFLIVIPFNVALATFFRKVLRRTNKNYRIKNENMSSKLSNMLEMLSVTKAHGLENEEFEAFQKSIKEITTSGLEVDRANAYFGAWSWVMNNLLSAVCLIFCAYLAIKGQIKIGDIVLYQSLFSTISSFVSSLISIVPQIGVGMEAVSSVSEIMCSEDVDIYHGKTLINSLKGKVDFENVSYRYPHSEQDVIKNFNLSVKEGECIAVVGSSGSGKSTIMNLIIGFLKPTQGELLIDNKPMEEINITEYRHQISVVSQNSILFAGTIRENITYGLPHYTEEDLQRVVKMANLEEFINEMPKGIDTEIGEHGGKLSGGQKQRITIARALIRNPVILILDEATSALDNISEFHVQKAISTAKKGRTTFIVAHRLSTIRDADRIVVMENGICEEIGTYTELMKKKGRFYKLKNLSDMNVKSETDSEFENEKAE